jgi:hypothetical protein
MKLFEKSLCVLDSSAGDSGERALSKVSEIVSCILGMRHAVGEAAMHGVTSEA